MAFAGLCLASLLVSAGSAAGRSTSHLDENGPQGMNQEAAVATYGGGDPNVTIAYVEGGINWHLHDAAALASVVTVDRREAPVPCTGATVGTATMVVGGTTEPCSTWYSSALADYDLASTGHVTAADWAQDPRVGDRNGNGVIDPEDLTASFCGAGLAPPPPGNSAPVTVAGFPCAISGWDFYDGQNDPATVDTAYGHANGQMDTIHSECPKCSILPVKAGEEALDRTDDLAKAWLFAADSGARVIVSVTADLGYSTFMANAVDFVHRQGIVTVESSNDFDSTDHQGGMFWPDVLPGNGAVVDAAGTAYTRSDETSWGTHDMFTVDTGGGSTSESTPTTGGLFGLLLSYGNTAHTDGFVPAPLTGDQAIQIMRSTARPVTDTTLSWAGGGGSSDGWNLQYGYGIPDMLAAARVLFTSHLEPPTGLITTPGWYAMVDPTTTASLPVDGTVTAPSGDGFSWTLQAAAGPQPVDGDWFPIGTGTGTGSFNGLLGTLDLSSIPPAFWKASPSVSAPPTGPKDLPTSEQYAVTLRLLVTDTTTSAGAEDRRAINVQHDGTLLPGFPKANGASIESQPALVDLQGTGTMDIVYADADGLVHALDPSSGLELPGWPAHSPPVSVPAAHSGVDPGHQSILDPVAVGDLDHTGALSVVVTSVDGTVSVFDAQGQEEPGWPRTTDTGVTAPAIPRPELPNVRLPVAGASSPPVLADLDGDHRLSIVQSGWDGYLHVWDPAGNVRPGWPVRVVLPAGFTPDPGYLLEADQKLDTPPAVAHFDGIGPPDLVVRSQETEITGGGIEPLPKGYVFAFTAAGAQVPGWPVTQQGLVEYYGSAQEFITEGTDVPVAADVHGTGRDEVAVGPIWTPSSLIDGNGTVEGAYGDLFTAGYSLLTVQNNPSLALDPATLPPETPIPFTSSGSFGRLGPPGSPLVFAQSTVGSATFAGAELETDSGLGINQFMGAWNAQLAPNGAPQTVSGFPAVREGLDFLGQPLFSDVSGGGQVSVVSGGDSNLLDAYTAAGTPAAGFPKFTGGWVTFAPSTGDLLGDGRTDVVAGTREGELFAWSTGGSATANDQWWHAQHDEYNSGNAGTDSRPPGVARNVSWSPGQPTVSFRAPGGDWYDGTVGHYEITYGPDGHTVSLSPSGPAGTTETAGVPVGTTGIRIVALDGAGNVSGPAVVGTPPPGAAGGYLAVGGDGGVFAFGDAGFAGSMAGRPHAPMVGISSTPSRGGYWEVAADGGVFAFGDARFAGSMGGRPLNAPVVGMAPTADGKGYWEVAADGGVFAFGDAGYVGSMGGRPLNAPVVGMAATPDGGGYWLVGSDGGIFAFGDARFAGSMGGRPLNAPVVGMAASEPSRGGSGYWLVGSDGGVFAFGDARYAGSLGGRPLNAPITGIAASEPTSTLTGGGSGYWLVGSDGGVFAFGDAGYAGSMGTPGLRGAASATGISGLPGVPG